MYRWKEGQNMEIETKYLGKTTIDEHKTIIFEEGLPGFEDETKFVLLDLANNPMFQILQSIKTKNLAFFVVNPYLFYDHYSIHINQSVQEKLQIENEKDVVVLAILTIKEPFSKSTVNLKAPLIINLANRHGKQYILKDDQFSMRTKIPQSKVESGV